MSRQPNEVFVMMVFFLTFGPTLGWGWIITRACHDTWWHPNFSGDTPDGMFLFMQLEQKTRGMLIHCVTACPKHFLEHSLTIS